MPALRAAALAALFCSISCSRSNGATTAGDGGLAANQTNQVTADAASLSTNDHLVKPRDAGPPPTCRVVDAIGTTPIVIAGMQLPSDWITLAPDAKLTVRHPKSLRESVFLGPGEVRPCVLGGELHQLRSGMYKSAPGSGESPGHEAWVVTPLAVVRYVVAGLTVQVDSKGKETIRVASGSARVWRPQATTIVAEDGGVTAPKDPYDWTSMPDGASLVLTAASNLASGDIEAECFAAAHVASARVRALHDDAGTSFGDRAAAHVLAFEATRAACSLAQLRLACKAGDDACALTVDSRTVAINAALLSAETGEETP